MSNLKEHTEALRSQVNNIATREQKLISALSEALSRADQKLLDDVRSVTIEHETRRAIILSEIHTLAARIGAFPATEEQPRIIEEEALDLPFFGDGENASHAHNGSQNGSVALTESEKKGGDWRQAAKNITEDLGFLVNGTEAAE